MFRTVFGRFRPSPAMVVAIAALVVTLGGVAYATIPDSNGVIHGCYNSGTSRIMGTGSLRVIDTGGTCASNETAINFAATDGNNRVADSERLGGVPAQDYQRTLTDTDRPFHVAVLCGTAVTEWAVVNANGTLARSGGTAPTIHHVVDGQYKVDFDSGSDISGCAYVASVGEPGNSGIVRGIATVATDAGDNKGVYVTTQD